MSERLKINFDILSDSNLKCSNKLSLSTFSVSGKTYIRRSTIIVEKNIVKKIFYPILSIEKHIKEIIEWLKKLISFIFIIFLFIPQFSFGVLILINGWIQKKLIKTLLMMAMKLKVIQ